MQSLAYFTYILLFTLIAVLSQYASPQEEEALEYCKHQIIQQKAESLRQIANLTELVIDIRRMAEVGEISNDEALSVLGEPYLEPENRMQTI